MTTQPDLDNLKKAAAVKAVEFVRDGMVVASSAGGGVDAAGSVRFGGNPAGYGRGVLRSQFFFFER